MSNGNPPPLFSPRPPSHPTAQTRLTQLQSHLSTSETDIPDRRTAILSKSPNDIVITACLRTPFTKGGRGGFKDTPGADLLVHALKSLIARSRIDPALVEDIAVGNVLAPGGGATEFRAAALVAGFPESTAVKSLNRQCSSGLQACVDVANAISAGMIEVGVGAGVESMSSQYGPGAVTEFSELLESHPEAKNCKVPMGVLSEKMAKERGVARVDQDAFAAGSYQKALKAQREGKFNVEIAEMEGVRWVDPKTDEEKTITVARDDGIREGMTKESLGKIKPAFAKDGSIHAGNASQISDGAAAVLMMKRSTATRLGQTIIGKFVASSVVGVKPLLMGIGPWKAIPVALSKAGISKNDVDVYEINEAFASQCLWCVRELGLDEKKVCRLRCERMYGTVPTDWAFSRSIPMVVRLLLAILWAAPAPDRSLRCSTSLGGRARRLVLRVCASALGWEWRPCGSRSEARMPIGHCVRRIVYSIQQMNIFLQRESRSEWTLP